MSSAVDHSTEAQAEEAPASSQHVRDMQRNLVGLLPSVRPEQGGHLAEAARFSANKPSDMSARFSRCLVHLPIFTAFHGVGLVPQKK